MMRASFLALLLAFTPPAFADTFKVTDGDTIRIGKDVHRLFGVDAFEASQTCHDVAGVVYSCGVKAKEQLEALTRDKTVVCEPTGMTSYNRSISRCTANGEDLSLLMVLSGWALDYPYYSRGEYRQAQSVAQVKFKGAHAGNFESPRDFRFYNKYSR